MSSLAVVMFDGTTTEWRPDRHVLVQAVERAWLGCVVDTSARSEVDNLRWMVGDHDLDAHMHEDLTCLYVRRWTTDEHLAFAAAWFRGLVPATVEVVLADTSGTYYVVVPPDATAAGVVELMRHDHEPRACPARSRSFMCRTRPFCRTDEPCAS